MKSFENLKPRGISFFKKCSWNLKLYYHVSQIVIKVKSCFILPLTYAFKLWIKEILTIWDSIFDLKAKNLEIFHGKNFISITLSCRKSPSLKKSIYSVDSLRRKKKRRFSSFLRRLSLKSLMFLENDICQTLRKIEKLLSHSPSSHPTSSLSLQKKGWWLFKVTVNIVRLIWMIKYYLSILWLLV